MENFDYTHLSSSQLRLLDLYLSWAVVFYRCARKSYNTHDYELLSDIVDATIEYLKNVEPYGK